MTLSLGDNVSGDWDTHLADAKNDWNEQGQSLVLANVIAQRGIDPTTCSPAVGNVEICNSTYGSTGWLGIAGIWVAKGKHITRGYVKVNDTYLTNGNYTTSAWRQMVLCQEIGHVFGLGHQDENFGNQNLNTCMDYTSNPESNQHPNQHDYDLLATKYEHLDGSGGGGGKNNGKGGNNGKRGEAPGQDVRQWGKAISTDGKGRPDLFELELGNGNKVFTHVLWAD